MADGSRPGDSPPARGRGAWTLDTRGLAALRVVLGLTLAADALLRAGSSAATLAPDGMLPPGLARAFVGAPWGWSLAFLADGLWCGRLVLALEGAAGLLLAAGFLTPLATTAAWVATVSIVRRTAPMTNAGDVLVAVLLFWGQFLPLGAAWSVDARRRPGAPRQVRGPGTVALVLQVAAVYLSAGLSKCNETWFSGDAVSYALSLHDHGTPLGDWVARSGWPAALLSRGTVALELLGPLLACLVPATRGWLVVLFVAFHVAIALTMDVCLFPWAGIAAWLALLPGRWWDRLTPSPRLAGTASAPRSAMARAACVLALVVAAAAFVHANGPWSDAPAPIWLRRAVQVTFLEQDWRVFGEIRRQRQWTYVEARLADGSVVDLLRGGRPLEPPPPAGGFHSIGDGRLQKLLWEIPKPDRRAFAEAVVARLALDWNARHPSGRRVEVAELRGGRRIEAADPPILQDVLLASWPPRTRDGSGNLDRFLRDRSVDGDRGAD